MNSLRVSIAAIAVAALAFASPMWAMAQTAPDPHHPLDGSTTAPNAQTPAPTPQPGMMDMMRMMQMMHQGDAAMSGMSMQGMDMAGIPMTDHIEGRIAFLRAELRITDAQADAWDAFADALRLQANRIADARKMVGESSAQTGFEQKLAMQEMLLSARLEGIRAVKTAYGNLDNTLSPEQRKTAEQLLGAHMGMMRGAAMPPMPMEGTAP